MLQSACTTLHLCHLAVVSLIQSDAASVDVYLVKKNKKTRGYVLQLEIAESCSKALLNLTYTDLLLSHILTRQKLISKNKETASF